MGTKMAVAFANIFIARIEKQESELHQTAFLEKEFDDMLYLKYIENETKEKITVTINVQWNCSLFSLWPADKNRNKSKNWALSSGNEKKKTGKKLKEEDANLKSETVQSSLKEYVSREVH